VCIRFWFLTPKAHTAANNDLFLRQQPNAYPQRNIASATSRKLAGQLWHLSEDLSEVLVRSLFDPDVDDSTKSAVLNASNKYEGDELDSSGGSLKRAVVDLSNVQQMTPLISCKKEAETYL